MNLPLVSFSFFPLGVEKNDWSDDIFNRFTLISKSSVLLKMTYFKIVSVVPGEGYISVNGKYHVRWLIRFLFK